MRTPVILACFLPLLACPLAAQTADGVLVLDLFDDRVHAVAFEEIGDGDDDGSLAVTATDLHPGGATHMSATADGRLLFTDPLAGRVTEWRPGGNVGKELRSGLNGPRAARATVSGGLLVAETGAHRVVEFDAAGAVRFEFTAADCGGGTFRPWDVHRTEDGMTLIADRAGGRLLKVDAEGELILSRPNLGALTRIAPMRDGQSVLVTVPDRGEVVVVRADGSLGTQLTGLNAPQDAIELSDGRLLVATRGALRMFTANGKGHAAVPQSLPVSLAPHTAAHRSTQRTLWIADYSDNRVIEVNGEGEEITVIEDIYGPFDVDPLPNGNVLVTEFALSRVIEYADGEIVWQYPNDPDATPLRNPYGAQRLTNGNTLIADTFGTGVIEVNPEGETVWYLTGTIQPADAHRTADGTTWIADMKRGVVEQWNMEGERLRQIEGLPNAHDIDLLPSGNLLVTLRTRNRVVEIDPLTGDRVWTLEGLQSPSDAYRLPDGTTLVAENGRVGCYAKSGERMWAQNVSWAVAAQPSPPATK